MQWALKKAVSDMTIFEKGWHETSSLIWDHVAFLFKRHVETSFWRVRHGHLGFVDAPIGQRCFAIAGNGQIH